MRHRVIRPSEAGGFTLIELLICLAVLSVLCALILPAIQQSREAARQVQCRSQLRQFAVATQSYISAHQVFPMMGGIAHWSVFVALLPHMEASALAAELGPFPIIKKGFTPNNYPHPVWMTCPSDSVANASRVATNYSGNLGVRPESKPPPTSFEQYVFDGVIVPTMFRSIPPDHVIDGLSHTAVFAEVLPRSASRPDWVTEYESNPTASELSATCLAATSTQDPQLGGGSASAWVIGRRRETSYQHVLAPNQRNCIFVQTSASSHPFCVQFVACDGSVRTANDSIDLAVWRGWGTRNGGEINGQ